MSRFNNPLNNVHVAAPCSADWDLMIGNELSRFCGQCNLNVYNLSGMTRSQAEHLIANNEGKLCMRFYRRADGSIITKNCPVGLRAIQRRVSKFTKAILSAVLSFITGVLIFAGLSSLDLGRSSRREVMGTIALPQPTIPQPPQTPLEQQPRLVMGGAPSEPRDYRRVTIGKMRVDSRQVMSAATPHRTS
ncbi:MAG: hypothetical protein M3R68_06030 [Acidobacteriota bacterium]|nr:hypothetical protein [Acidobacteriota bacterium]